MNKQILQQMIDGINDSSFASIDTETPVTLKGGKKNPLQNRVTKRTVGSSVMLFTNKNSNGYENMVKRRLEQEGKNPEGFILGVRKWGTRVPNTPFVEHNDQTYLEVVFLKKGKTEYLVDGKVFNGMIEGLEIAREEGDQGGLDNSVIIRTINSSNIKGITVNKQHHTSN
jgi:hypothetical protein